MEAWRWIESMSKYVRINNQREITDALLLFSSRKMVEVLPPKLSHWSQISPLQHHQIKPRKVAGLSWLNMI